MSTSDLYFVSKNNGTHQFSATLVEHNRAVEKYQKRSPRTRSSQTSVAPTEGMFALEEGVS
jgi:UPF0755 protein